MDLQNLVEQLRERIARLEATKSRRRAYNQQDAARELGISVNKLREAQRAGRIKGSRNGRIWSFTDAALQRYLAGQADAVWHGQEAEKHE
jgi:hypothetical protein